MLTFYVYFSERIFLHSCFTKTGKIYQSHPSGGLQKGNGFLQDTTSGLQATGLSSQRSIIGKTATMLPPSGYQPSYGNYQNCTIVQSHLPYSNYGTYVTLAPKTLIFPVFVQVGSFVLLICVITWSCFSWADWWVCCCCQSYLSLGWTDQMHDWGVWMRSK